MPSESTCWRAVLRRDAQFDTRFVYGVVTTRIFCRPSCPSRRAKRENVRFYASVSAARADRLRPCKRCRPETADPRVDAMTAVARRIEADSHESLSLATLAAEAGLSPSHLQRTFRAVVGVSPKQLHAAARFRQLRAALRAQAPVLDAVYAAGFGSSSRVYEAVGARLGMSPSRYRAGGAGERIVHATCQTSLGRLLLAATARGVCFVQFGDDDDALLQLLCAEFPRAKLLPSPALDDPELDAWLDALREHLDHDAPRPELPLDLRGTAFQIRVWRFLLGVGPGHTASYGEVARGLGDARGARAVANACAANRLALLVPCHRVLRGDGGLGGYRWGEDRKRELLARERARTRDP